MQVRAIFDRLSGPSGALQAVAPGLYAWGVTVAPAAFARGAPGVARAAAVAAVLALVAGVVAERRRATRLRLMSLWGFVLACALTWSASPGAMASQRVDTLRGLAGMLGWALFALASAAPALADRRAPGQLEPGSAPLAPRRRLRRGDLIYISMGVAAAVGLQLVGWDVAGPERALFLRCVALAASLAAIGASVDVSLARHLPRSAEPRQPRLRRATRTLGVLALLGLLGAVFIVGR